MKLTRSRNRRGNGVITAEPPGVRVLQQLGTDALTGGALRDRYCAPPRCEYAAPFRNVECQSPVRFPRGVVANGRGRPIHQCHTSPQIAPHAKRFVRPCATIAWNCIGVHSQTSKFTVKGFITGRGGGGGGEEASYWNFAFTQGTHRPEAVFSPWNGYSRW
ncbi:unnamed protein product, partial [Iphiclides podalirius]